MGSRITAYKILKFVARKGSDIHLISFIYLKKQKFYFKSNDETMAAGLHLKFFSKFTQQFDDK